MSGLHIEKIEDYEGGGFCSACQKDNLRWIVTLSDGQKIGTECAKKALGYAPKPAAYSWIKDYKPIREYKDKWETAVVWKHKTGTNTRLTVNGHLQMTGGGLQEFERRYGKS